MKSSNITIRVPDGVRVRLNKISSELGCTMTELVLDGLRKELRIYEKAI
jgi:hypothetical protein